MATPTNPKNARNFRRVVVGCTAGSLGAMAAFLHSIKQVNPTVEIHFTAGSALTFALAAVGAGFLCNRLLSEEPGGGWAARRNRRLWMAAFSVICALGMAAAFLLALQGVSAEKMGDVLAGAGAAIGVVSVLAVIAWRLLRFLESDSGRDDTGEL